MAFTNPYTARSKRPTNGGTAAPAPAAKPKPQLAPRPGTPLRPGLTKPRPAPRPGTGAPTNKPGLGSAPKPAAGPAVVPQQMEPDPTYLNTIDAVSRRSQERLGEIQGQEDATRHDFGIDDPTNPFSRAEGLKKAFLTRQKAASASLASQGQLYSGAHERAVARTRYQEEQARAELFNSYQQAMNGTAQARRGVAWDTEEEQRKAFEEWLGRAPRADVAVGPEDQAPEDAQAPAADAPPAPGPQTGPQPGAPAPRVPLAKQTPQQLMQTVKRYPLPKSPAGQKPKVSATRVEKDPKTGKSKSVPLAHIALPGMAARVEVARRNENKPKVKAAAKPKVKGR
jgi:hypothetical protein